ncbi:MAG: BON domain-containing protein [Bryobacterales bacterium]|nr:BON domain-containing protein [Bryobacterales bacterium]
MPALTVTAALLAAPLSVLKASTTVPPLEERVRHELLMLPLYGVFDQLTYKVNGDSVTLGGQVVLPTLKNAAETVVKRIPGVKAVQDQIEVLPLSPFDDQIRWAELRAIYGTSSLFRYNMGAVAPIRIIVNNGHVTLEGVVASQMDKQVAGMAAASVAHVFSVTNNLQVKSS